MSTIKKRLEKLEERDRDWEAFLEELKWDAPVIRGSPDHLQAIAEGRDVVIWTPGDEPPPENPVL